MADRRYLIVVAPIRLRGEQLTHEHRQVTVRAPDAALAKRRAIERILDDCGALDVLASQTLACARVAYVEAELVA